jgi:aerobic carbon-monoxide dehydrogenase large subunit
MENLRDNFLSNQLVRIAGMSKLIGRSIKRVEDLELVKGLGTYLDDVRLPNMLYAAFLRSPHAHATIKKIDTSDVAKLRGVVLVLTGDDVRKLLPPLPYTVSVPGMKKAACYCLAVDKVRYVGEPVAVVVANDNYVAQDAIELINVEYEVLPPVLDAEEALKSNAPIVNEEWGDNVMLATSFEAGDVEEALQKSDHVISERIKRHRYTGCPIETRGYVASYNVGNSSLTIYASTQTPHILKSLIAQCLSFPEQKIRVITNNVGGGFGVKIPLYQEEPLIPFLSIRTGKPVKWIETRREHMMATCHSREQVHYIELGVNKDGIITGLKDRIIADLGASVPQPGVASILATARFLPSGYKIDNFKVELFCVTTNKAPFGAVRGFGKADSNYVIERMMEIAAREIGMDPLEFRMKNLLRPEQFPYVSVTGAVYDSGNYPECMKLAKELIDYDRFKQEQKDNWRRGVYQGVSVVFMLEPAANAVPNSLHSGYESARIRIWPSGKLTVFAGVADQGQGHKTALAQIVADELGVPLEDISVVEGDTDACPYGLGAWASRFSVAGVGAVTLACRALREKLIKIAAHLLETRQEDIELKEGKLTIKGVPSKELTIREIANITYTQIHRLPRDLTPTLEAEVVYVLPNIRYFPDEKGRINLYPVYGSGAYAVKVQVDIDTGRISILDNVFVSDSGNIINPILLDGQIVGGVIQGIGGGMYEELSYSRDGHLLNSTLMDYLLPTAVEAPPVRVEHVITPSPVSIGGFKGAGEGGAIPPPVALVNAVEDALRPLGVRLSEMPLSPFRVWKAIHLVDR